MRALIVAWSLTLATLIALAVWLQVTYEPPATETAEVADPSELPDANTGSIGDGEPVGAADQAQDAISGEIEDQAPIEADATLAPDTTDTPAAEASEDLPAGGLPGTGLTEAGPHGPLPLSVAGAQPWRSFGTTDPSGGTGPRIAIIVTGLGMNARLTNLAISGLPAEVTLAFSPYGQNLELFAETARDASHETLLMVPMEPMDYPINDPGPHSLLTTLSAEENIDRLHFVMSRFTGYVGLINDMGSRFTTDQDALRPVMADLQRRGVMFVDSRATNASIVLQVARDFGIPWAENTLYIDNTASRAEIDRYLGELETMALARGLVVGVGHPYPITVERIIAWAPGLAAKGIKLVPITSTAFQRTVR